MVTWRLPASGAAARPDYPLLLRRSDRAERFRAARVLPAGAAGRLDRRFRRHSADRLLDPPLTTVRQPMYEIRQRPCVCLDLIIGASGALVTMPGDPILRASSGHPGDTPSHRLTVTHHLASTCSPPAALPGRRGQPPTWPLSPGRGRAGTVPAPCRQLPLLLLVHLSPLIAPWRKLLRRPTATAQGAVDLFPRQRRQRQGVWRTFRFQPMRSHRFVMVPRMLRVRTRAATAAFPRRPPSSRRPKERSAAPGTTVVHHCYPGRPGGDRLHADRRRGTGDHHVRSSGPVRPGHGRGAGISALSALLSGVVSSR